MSVAPKIESDDLTLTELYKDFYTVPDFQREYVWQTQHVERLLLDVFDEFYDEEGRLIDSDQEYFIGSIVACLDREGTFQLIDGQQRLTTIYLILCAVRDYLRELAEQPPETLQNQIKATSMHPRTGEDVPRYRLALQYEDSSGMLEVIAGATQRPASIPATTTSVRNILEAYQTIWEFLATNFREDVAAIKRFLAATTHRVKLIRVVTPNLAHALKVFETINERGVGLNAMDLLKNLLFMNTPAEQHARLKDRWKVLIDTLGGCQEKPLRFLRYYIMSHQKIDWRKGLREDEIYTWLVDHKQECGIDANPLGFVDQLVTLANAWANFLQGKDVQRSPNRYLRNIAAFSGAARQHFILLLAGQHLRPELFSELCRWLENLFFFYVITRESTKTFERNFARWSVGLREVEDAKGLKDFLNRYFANHMASRRADFRFAFVELTQSRIQQYRLRYILAKLTQFIEEAAWGNPVDAQLDGYLHGSVNIEHILPQSPNPEAFAAFDRPEEYDGYKEKLGNLTLLERTINTSVSNGTYEVKKAGYRQSSFLLTKSLVEKPQVGVNTQLNRAVRDLIQFETWDSASIETRQKMLAALAERVWLSDITSQMEDA